MWLFIQPDDTLFFRDGRPFDAGSDIWSATIFPPYPPTLYGMIRSLIVHRLSGKVDYNNFFAGVPVKYKELLGDKNGAGHLSVCGPFMAEKRDDFFDPFIPVPSDLWEVTNNLNQTSFLLQQPDCNTDKLQTVTDMDVPFCRLKFRAGTGAAKPEQVKGTIGGNHLLNYLNGQTRYIKAEAFWTDEPGMIIEKEKESHRAKAGHLAFPLQTRLSDSLNFKEKGFLLYVDGIDEDLFQGRAAIRLGGENRTVLVERVENKPFATNPAADQIAETGRFRVVLTSPGYFPNKGYYPDFLTLTPDGSCLAGAWKTGIDQRAVKLVSMITGARALRIGGWDMANHRPKRLIKAVPAGSVFFFEIPDYCKEGDEEWLTSLLDASRPGALPGGDDAYTREGFNTFLIGGWNYVQ